MNLNSLNLGSVASSAMDLAAPLLDSAAEAKDKKPNAAALQAQAEEFEGVFLSLLLKEMRTSLDNDGEGGLFAGEKSDTLGGLFDLYMGKHMASSGALGIADAIKSYWANQSHALPVEQASESFEPNPESTKTHSR